MHHNCSAAEISDNEFDQREIQAAAGSTPNVSGSSTAGSGAENLNPPGVGSEAIEQIAMLPGVASVAMDPIVTNGLRAEGQRLEPILAQGSTAALLNSPISAASASTGRGWINVGPSAADPGVEDLSMRPLSFNFGVGLDLGTGGGARHESGVSRLVNGGPPDLGAVAMAGARPLGSMVVEDLTGQLSDGLPPPSANLGQVMRAPPPLPWLGDSSMGLPEGAVKRGMEVQEVLDSNRVVRRSKSTPRPPSSKGGHPYGAQSIATPSASSRPGRGGSVVEDNTRARDRVANERGPKRAAKGEIFAEVAVSRIPAPQHGLHQSIGW